jgi:peptide/nickel transport system substrate-binding protein
MGAALGAPALYSQYLGGMAVEVLDRNRLRLTTAEPMADLLDVLSAGYILPPEYTGLGATFQGAPIGTGPYQFGAYQEGDRILLRENKEYFGEKPFNASLEWRLVPDPAERVRMVKENLAHIASTLDPAAVEGQDGIKVQRSRGTAAFIIIFNVARGPLEDQRVRLALNLGIDRQAIITQVLSGAGYPLTGFISLHHFGADPNQQPFPLDRDRARTLLREAGYGEGLNLTLDSPTSLPNEAVRLSKVVAEQLKRIGVEVSVHTIEDRELYANKVRRKEIHDMCIFDSSPLSTYRVLKEKIDSRFKGSWWQGYQNAKVERLLDQARRTVETSRREMLYRECFHLLKEDPPWLYLYHHQILTAVSSRMGGWRLPAHGIIDVRGLPRV